MFDVYSCNALSARFFDVDRALNSYFMIMIITLVCLLTLSVKTSIVSSIHSEGRL